MRTPTTPMHWVLQTEIALTAEASARPVRSGNVQIDWVAAWAYDPSADPGAAPADTVAPTVSLGSVANNATVPGP